MTERRPAGHTFESWVDKQIREAAERGEFDNLPGTGKPIPGQGRPDDENWWLREYLRREAVPAESLLPKSLRLKLEAERLPDTVRNLRTEQDVRSAVADLNARIRDWVRFPEGPRVALSTVDAESIVEAWLAGRTSRRPAAAPPADPPLRRRRRWWRR
jgi:hypothetical protein